MTAAPTPVHRTPILPAAAIGIVSVLVALAVRGEPLLAQPPAPPVAGPAAREGPPSLYEDATYETALLHYRDGRAAEALAVIDRALQRKENRQGNAGAALRTLAGWCHLRRGALDSAEREFRAAVDLAPRAVDARVGIGYVHLRRGRAGEAEAAFAAVLEETPRHADALKGAAMALRDQRRFPEAAARLRQALAVDPADTEAKGLLEQALAAGGAGGREARPRPPAGDRVPIRVVARAGGGRIVTGAEDPPGRPFFVKGINFGVALPGRFPAEFPEDAATYASWLAHAADLGANTVRLYTLLPPVFYAALETHNRRHPASPIWLMQGVWTELPDDHDYDGASFVGGLRAEIARVVDAVHGNLDLPARPGHAHGAYRADVSGHVVAWLLGREWEPHSVETYDRLAAQRGAAPFRGAYFNTTGAATPFEAWLAGLLDFTVDDETGRYRRQRPVSFVSWPTLDPLRHPTEATRTEEIALLRRRGEIVDPAGMLEYDNDGVTVDTRRIVPTTAARGGLFATYHAYPYYPDFMNLDPAYLKARDAGGPSAYIGYLRDLKRHHGDQPIVIAEFGVPSSRGLAHFQPQGWHHGGHTETRQAEIDARLLRDIDEAGLAGGVLFALLDEWFKRNWLVMEFEIPAGRNPLWLNALDPEQNYGVLAARPGKERSKVTVDGRAGDWAGMKPLLRRSAGGPMRRLDDGHDDVRTLRGLWAAHDEAYLYLRLDVERLDADGDGRPDWKDAWYLIGIDTYDARRGDHRLPIDGNAVSPAGFEFCVVLDGETTARLLVDQTYHVHGSKRRPYRSAENADGRYVPIRVRPNRGRLGRDGTLYPPRYHDRSPLAHGSTDRRDPDYSSLADWRAGAAEGIIEIRLGWALLNVADPSSRRVVWDDPDDLRLIGTAETPGFRFQAAAVRPGVAPGADTPFRARLADLLPALDAPRIGDLPSYGWPGWDRPSYRIERKDGWAILKEAFGSVPARGEAP
ncbi:MAG: tetratricopeptide repeat protein [Candidatus Polarisedimenticolia bacterium]